ncbi:MAG: hypothetical protein ACLRZ9_02930 [Eubacterium sp.]
MDNLESWKIFESTGKIEDYLKYADERRLKDARESFISAVEGEKTNGRDNYSSGNGNFLNGYK